MGRRRRLGLAVALALPSTTALAPPVARLRRRATRAAATQPAADEVGSASSTDGDVDEPDLQELKALFESTASEPRAPDAAVDDGGDDDDGDLASLFAPPVDRAVDAAETAAFVDKLDLEGLVDEEYGRAAEAVRAAAAAERENDARALAAARDAMVAEVEAAEREALAALEGRVGELVGRVSDREDAFEKALADVDRASAELAALERDATTFQLGAGVAAVALVAVAVVAGQ